MIIFAGKDNQKTVSVYPGFYHGKPSLFSRQVPFCFRRKHRFFITVSPGFFIECANIVAGKVVW